MSNKAIFDEDTIRLMKRFLKNTNYIRHVSVDEFKMFIEAFLTNDPVIINQEVNKIIKLIIDDLPEKHKKRNNFNNIEIISGESAAGNSDFRAILDKSNKLNNTKITKPWRQLSGRTRPAYERETEAAWNITDD